LKGRKIYKTKRGGLELFMRIRVAIQSEGDDMKTFDDVRTLGLYASDCCGEELIFDEDDCFSRCPRCAQLCGWELVEVVVSWTELEHMEEVPAA
jgi:hypothetical protein